MEEWCSCPTTQTHCVSVSNRCELTFKKNTLRGLCFELSHFNNEQDGGHGWLVFKEYTR